MYSPMSTVIWAMACALSFYADNMKLPERYTDASAVVSNICHGHLYAMGPMNSNVDTRASSSLEDHFRSKLFSVPLTLQEVCVGPDKCFGIRAPVRKEPRWHAYFMERGKYVVGLPYRIMTGNSTTAQQLPPQTDIRTSRGRKLWAITLEVIFLILWCSGECILLASMVWFLINYVPTISLSACPLEDDIPPIPGRYESTSVLPEEGTPLDRMRPALSISGESKREFTGDSFKRQFDTATYVLKATNINFPPFRQHVLSNAVLKVRTTPTESADLKRSPTISDTINEAYIPSPVQTDLTLSPTDTLVYGESNRNTPLFSPFPLSNEMDATDTYGKMAKSGVSSPIAVVVPSGSPPGSDKGHQETVELTCLEEYSPVVDTISRSSGTEDEKSFQQGSPEDSSMVMNPESALDSGDSQIEDEDEILILSLLDPIPEEDVTDLEDSGPQSPLVPSVDANVLSTIDHKLPTEDEDSFTQDTPHAERFHIEARNAEYKEDNDRLNTFGPDASESDSQTSSDDLPKSLDTSFEQMIPDNSDDSASLTHDDSSVDLDEVALGTPPAQSSPYLGATKNVEVNPLLKSLSHSRHLESQLKPSVLSHLPGAYSLSHRWDTFDLSKDFPGEIQIFDTNSFDIPQRLGLTHEYLRETSYIE